MANRAFNKRLQKEIHNIFSTSSDKWSPNILDVKENLALPEDNGLCSNVPCDQMDTFDCISDFPNLSESTFQSVLASFDEIDYPSSERIENDSLNLTLSEELLFFFITFNIPRRVMQHLLDILVRHEVPNVPPSVHLLQKSLKNITIDTMNVERGEFAYLGIQNNLEFLINKGIWKCSPDDNGNVFVDIKLNIDGLPLFKSSRVNLWTILMETFDCFRPLPIALFCGIGKPNLVQFSEKLCSELVTLRNVGVVIEEFTVKIRQIVCVCDSPARAFLLGTKGHSSFNGCHWCRQVGFYLNERVVYNSVASDARTDLQYASFLETNQLERTPFIDILPMYSCVPPDFMHVVCLGVVRKLLHFYFTRIKGLRLRCKLSAQLRFEIDERIRSLKSFFPQEFQRKPRPIGDLEYFKASEFRTFLLYTGPFLLKSSLTTEYYEHFLLLHFAIYVYSSSSFSHLHLNAKACIDGFVSQCPQMFHECLISFNFHALLHIPEFVSVYGALENFSAFRFESYLSLLKRRIRATNGIFQQSIHQLLRVRDLYTGPVSNSEFFFSTSSPNNCCISENGDILLIDCISNKLVSGIKLYFVRDLYTNPYPSSTLGIGYYAPSKSFAKCVVPVKKAIAFPLQTELLIFPLV
jgi:hypothetical protein